MIIANRRLSAWRLLRNENGRSVTLVELNYSIPPAVLDGAVKEVARAVIGHIPQKVGSHVRACSIRAECILAGPSEILVRETSGEMPTL